MLLSQSKAIILGAGLLVIGLISGSGAYAANDSAGDVVLDCTFTEYKNTGYSVKLAKSWIPELQTHRISGDQVTYATKKGQPQTTLKKRNQERMEWTYVTVQYDKLGKRYDNQLIYTYFFTNGKIATKMRATGYRDIEHVWGSCE